MTKYKYKHYIARISRFPDFGCFTNIFPNPQNNRLSLRNNRLKFKIARKLPIILEKFIEYTPTYPTKTGGCERNNS